MSQSSKKSAGRPPSDIWNTNNCPNVPSDIQQKYLNKILERFEKIKKNTQTKIIDFYESSKLSPERINEINKACVKAFVICAALKEKIRKFNIIGEGLKQWVNTRWYTVYECVNSIIHLKEPLENYVRNSTYLVVSLEDRFPKNEDYLVQLALKLFSIVPHAAGYECVWSRLGWLYKLRRNRLAFHKIEHMHKLASYYYSHAKYELPYFGIEKTNTEVFDILVDEYLNLDEDDFVEIDKVGLNKHEENTNLNYYDENREETSSTNQLQEDINWSSIEEVDKIIENI
ncbi:4987_t:CDS:2 [Gigaspora margarita]|uniref:4987_t:CDS:1 n=1 Tax=Gigaspora margarita TaxID=4874 RepID=A0ABN7VJC0_GIGMA|nr:4987_t:CDS:2 [Gigaspora margarita]